MGGVGVGAPGRVVEAVLVADRQVDELHVIGRHRPVRLPEGDQQRRLLLGRGAQLGDQRALRARRHRLERQVEAGHPVGARRAPVGGVVDETALRDRLGGGEDHRAVLQRLPGGQAGAELGDMGGVGDALLGVEAEIADLDDAAGLDLLGVVVGDVGRPDLQRRVDLAVGHGLVHVHVAGGDVLDLVAGGLQHGAGDMGGDVLAGPFVDGQADRLVDGAHLGGADRTGQQSHRDGALQDVHLGSPCFLSC